jgi:hypothetical protein
MQLKAMALAALLLCAGAGVAHADDASTGQQSVAEILRLQHGLRERLEKPSGDYSRFDQAAIGKMERAQDKVFHMLDGVASLDELNMNQKTELSNALDEIKAVLLANEPNRLICHRERRTGTNLVERRCETVAQREERAREADMQMRHDGIAR